MVDFDDVQGYKWKYENQRTLLEDSDERAEANRGDQALALSPPDE